jgi:hypothetical protein
MILRLSILLGLIYTTNLTGQPYSISHSVISVASGYQEFLADRSNTLAFSVGESVVKTLQADGNDITQGFLQPKLRNDAQANKSNSFVIFPNPVHQNTEGRFELIIKFLVKDIDEYYVQVFNLCGIQIIPPMHYQNIINKETISIYFDGFPRGMYLVYIFSADNTLYKTEKIIKIE